ncbi:hypothetical protein K402DRAFT_413537 [Aulographum hederae CBS 113979]|uniref:PhoD-like phosphatase domain-containing protein n=1 Tax=Aulographum hederae CBS 113979 TaxID=1176131 RepID=A0A6G1GWD0_9PEZI|nr:hypothetical protein K402DRAFT_413537 [Aulographum hederae CBS 113979]
MHALNPNGSGAPPLATGQNGTTPHAVDAPNGLSTSAPAPQPSGSPMLTAGPLLNYKRMSNELTENPVWHGSVLIVLTPGQIQPELQLKCLGRIGPGNGDGALPTGPSDTHGTQTFRGERLYEDPTKLFFRFEIRAPFQEFEAKWEYSITPELQQQSGGAITPKHFIVPSKAQSMRILFHSCNGFSVGTDMATWQGPNLWHDVLRQHDEQPFHVMIGGGDQIYNDGVRVDGPLKQWTDVGNPHKRRNYPFGEQLRADCDDYYYKNYVDWYTTEPFRTANAQIAQLNIWDDHDIIDGFGSYTDHFMRCAVFRGIGGVAQKYYLLFQHHIAPPPSTFTTDAPKTTQAVDGTTVADPVQSKNTYVLKETHEDPSFIIGNRPGPYVEEKSRSLFCQLGARIAFLGIDARTERTRHQINYPDTYDLIFNRVNSALSANKNIKHLVLLLGVPIAYPRLQWLENIFQSPLIGPIKFLNKRFGFAGGLFNHFDGNIDLLDDLDDHYTAHQHKPERKELVLKLQELSKQHSVRVTILGGDVHLAAVGRFYSKPSLNIKPEHDFRYMPNVISSAITNKPPPAAVANLLARRNKIHHLDHETDETLLEIFDKDPGLIKKPTNGGNGVSKKTADVNHATMPSRNYAIIAESHAGGAIVSGGATNGAAPVEATGTSPANQNGKKFNPRHALHAGEENAGTTHPAASGVTKTGLCGTYGLDITLRVEITPSDKEGKTDGYGFSVPGLDASAYAGQGTNW